MALPVLGRVLVAAASVSYFAYRSYSSRNLQDESRPENPYEVDNEVADLTQGRMDIDNIVNESVENILSGVEKAAPSTSRPESYEESQSIGRDISMASSSLVDSDFDLENSKSLSRNDVELKENKNSKKKGRGKLKGMKKFFKGLTSIGKGL